MSSQPCRDPGGNLYGSPLMVLYGRNRDPGAAYTVCSYLPVNTVRNHRAIRGGNTLVAAPAGLCGYCTVIRAVPIRDAACRSIRNCDPGGLYMRCGLLVFKRFTLYACCKTSERTLYELSAPLSVEIVPRDVWQTRLTVALRGFGDRAERSLVALPRPPKTNKDIGTPTSLFTYGVDP